jgi:hypothetical protein
MKKSQYTESQIVAILKETDTGMKLAEVCMRREMRECDRRKKTLIQLTNLADR